nr:immunoglobulin light chain junction region [Macaca mulatta]MOV66136.1 immunoglobulin light chain junction region [Macaca mulatta]MOV66211.1 immunoglobulin light chain junction region [Macaca mulatta]MOV66272.1 immunoglobulin light chain junction region [Macaca mulatta]MOV66592.1 immunoglobulin light chain junction region [Macaca mulatta]
DYYCQVWDIYTDHPVLF